MPALAPPVQVVASGAPPFVHVPSGAPPFVAVSGNAPPITIVASGAPPITLFNEDGSLWAGGAGATPVGGAAVLVGETDGFATDFTYATDASRVAIKTAGTAASQGLDTFYTNASASPKQVFAVAGTLGWSPHNYCQSSQAFDNATYWNPTTAVTVTANAITAPDGTLTAEKIIESSTALAAHNILHTNNISSVTGETYCVSVYAKAGERNWLSLSSDNSVTPADYFNLTTGTIGNTANNAVMTSVGNGWYRCSIYSTQFMRNPTFHIRTSNGGGNYTGDGVSGLYLWGAQVNRGSTPLAYMPTTTVARFGLAVDYHPSTHAALGLLVEKAATNLVAGSENLASGWDAPYGMTIAKNATGPMGANTAWTLTVSAAGTAAKTLFFNGPVAGTYRYSVYAKAGTLTWISLGDGNQPNAHGAFFNLSAGTVGTVVGRFSAGAIQAVGNGWYRCSATVTTSAGFVGIAPHPADNTGTGWTAVGGETILICAPQAETGSIATSYIPTFSASATRAADNVTFLVSAIPAWTTEFSIYCRLSAHVVTTNHWGFCLTNGPGNDYVGFQYSGGAIFNLNGNDAGGVPCQVLGPVVTAGTSYSVAARIKLNDCNMSVDGAAVGLADTAVTVATPLVYGVFSSDSSNAVAVQSYRIQKLMIVPRGWSDAQLVTQSAVA